MGAIFRDARARAVFYQAVLFALLAALAVFAWRNVHERHIPVEEVARADRARRAAREAVLERLQSEGALS